MENNTNKKRDFKLWIKKHKTVLAVGLTAVGGIGLSALMYRNGYDKGHYVAYDKGFKDACNFNEAEYNRRVNG